MKITIQRGGKTYELARVSTRDCTKTCLFAKADARHSSVKCESACHLPAWYKKLEREITDGCYVPVDVARKGGAR